MLLMCPHIVKYFSGRFRELEGHGIGAPQIHQLTPNSDLRNHISYTQW
jgi:hypothetical protein